MKSKVFEDICQAEKRKVPPEVLEEVLLLAVEIAREGREGRKIGTMFVIGDSENVLRRSRPLILDPLYGHPPQSKRIFLPEVRESIKELAQLDGAFIISNDGTVVSAARYIDVSSDGVKIPLGLGSRHMAAASVTKHTDSVAVVVSESSIVRVFEDGNLISEIIPELWMLREHALNVLGDHVSQRTEKDLTVRTRSE